MTNLDEMKLSDIFPLESALQTLTVLAEDANYHGLRGYPDRREKRPDRGNTERRAFVRAVFALVESMVYVVKQLCLADHTAKFNAKELAFLKEQGKLKPFTSNLKSTFKLYRKASGIAFKPDYRLPGWSALLNAKRVRDRLTHPKKASDLNVTESEFKNSTQAMKWMIDAVWLIAKASAQGVTSF
jgi:hypothetical protein